MAGDNDTGGLAVVQEATKRLMEGYSQSEERIMEDPKRINGDEVLRAYLQQLKH